MARASVNKNYFNFIGGLHTDGSALASVPNTSSILENIDLNSNGVISRRLGLNYEPGFQLSVDSFTDSELRSSKIGYYDWPTVAGDGRRNFFVVRVGEKLYIFNQSGDITSDTLLGTIDISGFSINSSDSPNTEIQVSSGKGFLFVTGELYEPFFVSFDTNTETFSTTQIRIEIRDFNGVDDGFGIEERVPAGTPSPITGEGGRTIPLELEYNLLNQGWGKEVVPFGGGNKQRDYIAFLSQQNVIPSNADIPHLGITVEPTSGDTRFKSELIVNSYLGGTRAPQGHFILNAMEPNPSNAVGWSDFFNTNQTFQYNIAGLPIVAFNTRPRATAFYSGRVWYGSLKGNIYFSQILESTNNIGRCYQEQDPTAEEFNQLLDTDGGVITIPDLGEVHKIASVGSALLVMADNGIWQIDGAGDNFTANRTSVTRVSKVGISSYRSVVAVEDNVFFWSEEGIFIIAGDNVTGRLAVRSISDNRVNNFYDSIPAVSKIAAQGTYDRVSKKIYWSYHDGLSSTPNRLDAKYNSILIFDVQLNAYHSYRVEDVSVDTGNGLDPNNSSFMAGMTKASAVNEGVIQDTVVVDDGSPDVVTVGGDPVTVSVVFEGAVDVPVKVLTFAFDGSSEWQITFSQFFTRSFKDWESQDAIGVGFTSIVEINPETLQESGLDKQATYLTTYYDRKRNGFGAIQTNPRPDPVFGYKVSQSYIEIVRSTT